MGINCVSVVSMTYGRAVRRERRLWESGRMSMGNASTTISGEKRRFERVPLGGRLAYRYTQGDDGTGADDLRNYQEQLEVIKAEIEETRSASLVKDKEIATLKEEIEILKKSQKKLASLDKEIKALKKFQKSMEKPA